MAALTNTDPNLTYKDLYQTGSGIGSGITSSLQNLSDGFGNTAPIQFSSTGVNIVSGFTYNGHAVSFAGAITFSGAFSTTIVVTGTTTVTLPTSGTLYGTAANSITSAQLAGSLTDETGSGSVVFSTSPVLVTPALGIPTSGTLTNCTGLPITTGVSGLGTGIAAWLATPSSANLFSALTTKTGSGLNAFATSPTFITPIINGSNGFPCATFSDSASSTDYWTVSGNVANGAQITLQSSNSNASGSILAKGAGGFNIGSSGATTTPIALQVGSNTIGFSVPTLSAGRSVTFPDSNVTLASKSASVLSFSGAGSITASNTFYMGTSAIVVTTNTVAVAVPFACTVSNLYCSTVTAPGTGHTQTYTVYKNNSSTAITCAINDTAVTANDTSHSITLAAGDTLTIQLVMGASATTTAYVQASLQLTAL